MGSWGRGAACDREKQYPGCNRWTIWLAFRGALPSWLNICSLQVIAFFHDGFNLPGCHWPFPLWSMPVSSLYQKSCFLLNNTNLKRNFYIGYWPNIAHNFSFLFVAPLLSATSLDCREMLFIIVKSHLIRAVINPWVKLIRSLAGEIPWMLQNCKVAILKKPQN